MRVSIPVTNQVYPGLVRDALALLDRYGTAIADRDTTRSLDEDGSDLLRRVRAAMEPLLLAGATPDAEVAQLTTQIDALLATESPVVQGTAPRMGAGAEGRGAAPARAGSRAD
jgi:hypothetical protein